MSFEIVCECGQRMRAQEAHIGRETKCPRCHSAFVVPSPYDSPESEEPSVEFAALDGDSSEDSPIGSHPYLPSEHAREHLDNRKPSSCNLPDEPPEPVVHSKAPDRRRREVANGWQMPQHAPLVRIALPTSRRTKLVLVAIGMVFCWIFLAPTRFDLWHTRDGDVKRGAGISVYFARNTPEFRAAITEAKAAAFEVDRIFENEVRWKGDMAHLIEPDALRLLRKNAQVVDTNASGTGWVWLLPGEYIVWTSGFNEGCWVARHETISLTHYLSLGERERVEADFRFLDRVPALSPAGLCSAINKAANRH